MTNLLTKTNIGSMVPVIRNEYIEAMRSPKVMDTSDYDLDFIISGAINRANLDLGLRNIEKADVNYLCDRLMEAARQCFSHLAVQELIKAIDNGVNGKYDKERPFKLTVVNVTGWWNAYMQDNLRQEARRELAKEAEIKPSEAELQQMRLKRVSLAFGLYKTSHPHFYDDKGGLVFDMINRMGKIPFDEAKEAEILARAKAEVIKWHTRPQKYANDRAKLKEALNKVLAGDTTLVIIAAKRIALSDLFDYLISIDADIIQFLNQ